ncbi:MAG: AI-2E family transporter [Lachnospiraceae bacterium]|nr:AI-2E family transporter [Lachnospiraceae bacterium]
MDFFKRSDYQRVVLYIMISVSVLFVLKYFLPYFLPLLVALLIVVPLQRFCQRRERTPDRGRNRSGQKGFMAGGILFGIMLIVALIIVGLGTFLISKARTLVQNADFWTDSIAQLIAGLSTEIEDFFQLQQGTVERWISERIAELGECFTRSSDGLLTGSLRYLSVAGRAGTFVIVSFICVVLFAREVEGWQQGLLNLAAIEPAIDHILSIILRIGKKLGNMIKTYLKTQTIILICISITATAGLYLGGTSEGWFYGILAGFMDFLPFIGTGIVLIPIGVMGFLKGNIGSGVIVILTYFLCVLIREFLEPRLLGNGLKFSPVAILISVYAGVIYYGISGVILGPVTLLILVELGREIFMPRNK